MKMDFKDLSKGGSDRVISTKSIIDEIQKPKKFEFILPLGLNNFDNTVLRGGFYPHQKYLIFGANKTGKTQICHQICIQTYKLFSQKSEQKDKIFTYYLDLENTFRPERIQQLAINKNLDYKKVFKSINISKIMSNSALLLKLKEIKDQENLKDVKVLIIDSINNYYRIEQGDKEISFHNTKTNFLKILKIIDEITRKHNLITIATAQITPNFIQNAIIEELPVGNQFLNHFFSEYIYLRIKNNKYCMHLVNSQILPEKKVIYQITTIGIEDYEIK